MEAYRERLGLIHDFPGWVDFQGLISESLLATTGAILPRFEPLPSELTVLLSNFFVALLITCLIFLALNVVLNAVWPSFQRIDPAHKKMYVVANLVKSVVLGLQCSSISWLWYAVPQYACTVNVLGFSFFCAWDLPGQQFALKNVCITYVVTDVAALLLVRKLPASTKLHHYATSAFLAWVLLIDIAASLIAQKLMLYGFWSTLAFPVNTFLALRVVCPDASFLHFLAKLSAVVYMLCCFANWALHLLWLIQWHSPSPRPLLWLIQCILDGALSPLEWACTLLYLAAISALVNDDVKLMLWLRSFSSPRRQGGAKAAGGDKTRRKTG